MQNNNKQTDDLRPKIKEVHTNKECIEAIKKAKKGEIIFFNEY